MAKSPRNLADDDVDAAVLAALERRRDRARTGELPRPVRALALARWCGVRPNGSDDSRKRGVRLIIDRLRAAGCDVVSNFHGYRLATSSTDHAEYQQFRRRMGLAHLVDVSADRRSDGAAALAGQLPIWPP